MTGVLMALLLAQADPVGALEQVKNEPDLVKRSEKALALADSTCARARAIVRESGSRTELLLALEVVAEAAELSLKSLRDTGRKASKLAKQYKRGELRTRDMVRQMGDIAMALSLDDRPAAEKLRARVSMVHEDFLLGVMSGK